ncbi:hypothetical protein ARMSODRAFT_1039571 [Armillaria solidipes]|uniref:Uncharacterized protein n=1 Tax=Armillaria solidipes TaxID=1076256 RepID=A0A2H3BW69_9AGAR|nr:hypothetical protein ARMSODRAFT_1039571 [Armillaria solidipes]
MVVEKETITQSIKVGGAAQENLTEEADNVRGSNLHDLLPFGFGIHHAGKIIPCWRSHLRMNLSFLCVLRCTSLEHQSSSPKGTQIYNLEKCRQVELSLQDVLDMLGLIGRPWYDTYGKGIIITNHSKLQYHLSLLS